MRALVVIPAYNEESTIGNVVRAVPIKYDVVVVDDGSTDATMAKAEKTGACLLHHVVNRGLGAALRTGFAFAAAVGYDAVVTLDADGQHDPQEIDKILDGLTRADLVIGKRANKQMPRQRRLYNQIARGFTHSLFGGGAVDTESGFRAISVAALAKMSLVSSRMEISSELVAEAHRLRLRIVEIPITVMYTKYSMSKGQGLLEGTRTAWRLLTHVLK